MNFLQTFRVNSSTVVSEIFDEEIVIIHLGSGTYYSLDQSGAEIWQLLQQGATLPEITAQLATIYSNTPVELEHAVQHLMTELAQEQLIIPGNSAAQPSQLQNVESILSSSCNQRCFTPPSLNKYTDMRDLLLLDPIPEVDAGGWPRK